VASAVSAEAVVAVAEPAEVGDGIC